MLKNVQGKMYFSFTQISDFATVQGLNGKLKSPGHLLKLCTNLRVSFLWGFVKDYKIQEKIQIT